MNNFVIILGEPNSINAEILAKSNAINNKAIIIGNYNLLKSQLKILKIKPITQQNKIDRMKAIKGVASQK